MRAGRLRRFERGGEGRLALAIAGVPGFEVTETEAAGGVAYTVDTLRRMRTGFGPDDELFLILGADSLCELHTWRSPGEIPRLATLAVYERKGWDPETAGVPFIRIDGPLIEISSTEIRARLAGGRPVRFWLPEPVRKYAASRGLYATGSGAC